MLTVLIELISIGLTTRLVRDLYPLTITPLFTIECTPIDYEQQRRDLLRKHGIDLADGGTTKKKHMDRKTVEEIMGDESGGLFTWRDKNRKKVRFSLLKFPAFRSNTRPQLAYSV